MERIDTIYKCGMYVITCLATIGSISVIVGLKLLGHIDIAWMIIFLITLCPPFAVFIMVVLSIVWMLILTFVSEKIFNGSTSIDKGL